MIKVWVIEDNLDMRNSYVELINSSKDMICTLHCGSMESALTAFQKVQQPDIILLDIGLPGMNGIEGLAIIKSKYPNVNIIIQTVFDDNEKIFQAICAGASGYLLKRTVADKILDNIREVQNGGAPMNAQIARKVLHMFSSMVNPKSDYNLTEREKELLQMLINGKTLKKIGEEKNISYFTVTTHMKNIYSKLHVSSMQEAVSKAIKENLL